MGKRWGKRHKLEVKAHRLIQRYVKSGIIVRPKICDLCKRELKVDGHHEDYTLPLDVLWVCSGCHKKIHSGIIKLTEENRSGIVKNKQIIMMSIADSAIQKSEERKRKSIENRKKRAKLKGNVLCTPPVLVISGNLIMAVCQSCNHVWTIRKTKPIFCPKCHRVNHWENS